MNAVFDAVNWLLLIGGIALTEYPSPLRARARAWLRRDWFTRWYLLLAAGPLYGVATIGSVLVLHDWPEAVKNATGWAMVAWLWWRSGGGDQTRRLVDRTASRVVEVAGRLRVGPPAPPATP